MKFYAKPKEGPEGTYEYHVNKCLEITSRYLELHRRVLEKVCSAWGLTFGDFALLCRRAAFLHDLGKLGDVFQENMRCKLNSSEKEGKRPQHYFRHELLSARLLYQMRDKKSGRFPYDVWAVLGHHRKLDVNWTSFAREREDAAPDKLTPEQIKFGLTFSEMGCGLASQDEEGWNNLFDARIFADKKTFDDETINWAVIFLNNFRQRYLLGSSPVTANRALAALVRGILGYADWTASAAPDERKHMCIFHDVNCDQLNIIIRNEVEKKRRSGSSKYMKRPFQAACEKISGNILAIAPTGSGKTEAALLWATNQGPGKILFLMPTRVTSNSIYERMKTYFKAQNCGISHSGAGVYLAVNADNKNNDDEAFKEVKRISEDKEQEDIQFDAFKMLRRYKAFMAPVMVATVDQLLTANFNVGDWFFKELATLGASVVFDEIHAYEPYTLALITESIKRIKDLGGRVMVMSATMPPQIQKHFQELLEVEVPVVAEELMDRRKCFWEYREDPLESFDEEILCALEKGQKTAVIVNTVREAQKVYLRWKEILLKRLPEKNIMCYHSNFIMMHRDEKEKRLLDNTDEEGRPSSVDLLIATQAIEVSLDISFDLMFSEAAPFDSLIQRAGRCNRFGRSEEGRFIVFPISDIAKKFVYRGAGTNLQRTTDVLREHSGLLSERELSEMLAKVYQDIQIYDKSYAEGQNLVQRILGENTQILDTAIDDESAGKLTTREFNYIKIPVIPFSFLPDIEKLLKCGDRTSLYKISQFEVPVAASKKLPISRKIGHLYICEMDYDKEIGVHNDFEVSDVIF